MKYTLVYSNRTEFVDHLKLSQIQPPNIIINNETGQIIKNRYGNSTPVTTNLIPELKQLLSKYE